MPGIAMETIAELQQRIAQFNPVYMQHWSDWLNTPSQLRPHELKLTLGRWQACRGNPMRHLATIGTAVHPAPYIDDLFAQALPYVQILSRFDMAVENSFNPRTIQALHELWNTFERLSYERNNPNRKKRAPRQGLAGVVGISKAVMLVTNGRVGPAFDSKVRDELQLKGKIESAGDWIEALHAAAIDISTFEKNNKTTLQLASGIDLPAGRIHDMALGPKKV
ncbi:hypothetical protein ABH905_003980 [Pseudomonas frederiksbergensis]|uniref:hypothetical protein n=1 Tax=Pseudomonas frederiksbergensis TaxID=104087 RepID=UPI003D1FB145